MATLEQIRVLIIEDEPYQAQVIKAIISAKLSADIEIAGSCAATREILSRDVLFPFDIITLDYQLPDGNGFDLLQEISSLEDPPSVVMVTGRGNEEIAASSIQMGASAYVVKEESFSVNLESAVNKAFREVSGRRQALALEKAQEELARTEARYRAIVEDQVELVSRVKPKTFELTFLNDSCCRYIDVSREDLIGKSFLPLLSEEDQSRITHALARVTTEKETVRYETRLTSPDGAVVWHEWSSCPILDVEGDVVEIQAVGTDITDRKRAELEVEAERDLAMTAFQASSLDEILGMCLDSAIKVAGLDAGVVYRVDESTGDLVLARAAGLSDEFIENVSHVSWGYAQIKSAVAGGPAYGCIGVRQPFPYELEGWEGLKAFAILPIFHEEGMVACMNMASHVIDEVPLSSRKALEAIAVHAGLLIGREMAEERLRLSEQKFQRAFDGAQVMMAVLTVPDGTFLEVNEALIQATGLERDEIVGRPAEELPFVIMPQGRDRLAGIATRGTVISGEEIEYLDSSGEKHVTLTSIAPIMVGGQSCVLTSSLDITERNRAEEALKRSEEQFRALFENAMDVVAVLQEDGVLAFVTPSVERLLGFKPQEILGKNAMDFVHPDDLQVVMAVHLGALADPENDYHLEYRMRGSDGSWVHIETFGRAFRQGSKVIGTLVNARDITERKRAEEAARMSAARAETMARVSKEVAGAGLEHMGILETIARSVADTVGDLCVVRLLTDDDQFLEVVAVEHHDPEVREFAAALAMNKRLPANEGLAGTVFSTGEPMLVRSFDKDLAMNPDHELMPYSARYGVYSIICVPLAIGSKTIGTLGLSREVPERLYTGDDLMLLEELAGRAATAIEMARLHKRVSDELNVRRRRERELEAANLELQGFAHTVSHDLKGPISTIKLSLEILKERRGSTTEDETAEILEALIRNVGKSYALVENLLELAESGQHPTSLDKVDVSEVANRVIEDMGTELNEKGVLIEMDTDLGSVYANRTHVYQVFSNLIGNAIRHGAGTKPRVSISFLGVGESGANRYLVRDNGPGILEPLLDKIFDPFVKGEGGGTGIGLAIVDKVVKIYAGEVKAYNDRGACFEFTLADYPWEAHHVEPGE